MTLDLKSQIFKFVQKTLNSALYTQHIFSKWGFVDHAIRFNEYKTRNESVYAKYL